MTDEKARRFLHFQSAALPDDTLLVTRIEGFEEISRPYRYELELVSEDGALDLDAVLENTATFSIEQGVPLDGGERRGLTALTTHGRVFSIRQIEQRFEWFKYLVTMSARLRQLEYGVQSRIFLDSTAPMIVKKVLEEEGFISDRDFEFRLGRDPENEYPRSEYTVQYRESNLAFISRLLEHEGIFYFFEQAEECEKVVFGDSTAAYLPIPFDEVLPYKPEELAQTSDEAPASEGGIEDWLRPVAIHRIDCERILVPQDVVLRDYNWKTPRENLEAQAHVHSEGLETVYEYGDNYKTLKEGQDLAMIRAEELGCRRTLFQGQGDARAFRAGMTYQLSNHYREDFNTSYLLTHVHHQASQSVERATSAAVGATYRNTFVSIPAELTFRPERVTRKPRIQGVLNATIDASGDGQYAEIDEHGRYKVKLPFDRSDADAGKASRFIRMAQPYAGGGMGMHFPLHKGTEVMLIHVNGDPDRPIIAGAVPNPDTASPVQGGNQTQCAVHTGGGNQITIEDSDGSQRIILSSPTSGTSISIGAPPE